MADPTTPPEGHSAYTGLVPGAKQPATLVFFIREGKMLLFMKMKGVGKGKRNAPGGKAEPGESSKECAVREAFEETGGKNGNGKGIVARTEDLRPSGLISFFFPESTDPAFVVACYVCEAFEGEPEETDEMTDPQWFPIHALPLHDMMPADRLFAPQMAQGATLEGWVRFADEIASSVRESDLKPVAPGSLNI